MSKPDKSLFKPVAALSEVTAESAATLGSALKIVTIADLAQSPHFRFADELIDAATNPRHPLRRFGIPGGRVVKAFAEKPFEELADAPLIALEGIDDQKQQELMKTLGVKNIRQLALWPPFIRAQEILEGAVQGGVVSGDGAIFRVSGFVARRDGSPVGDAELKILRHGIRKPPSPLGDPVKTNAKGGFVFEYQRPATPIDLRVELIADVSKNIGETGPKIIVNAGEDEGADFVVAGEKFVGPSTFKRLERAIERGLSDEGLKPLDIADFNEADLARLALKAGIDPRTLVLLRQSYALAAQTQVPAEILFGMGREKVPLGIQALLTQNPFQRRAAVKKALAANHISAALENETETALGKLQELAVAEALKQPATPDVTTLGSLLGSAGLPAAKQKPLVDAYVKHAGTNQEFWKAVRTNGVLTDAELNNVQFTLQLGVVTQNHAPLIAALKARGISQIKGVAELGKAEWLALITGTPNGQPVGLPADLKAGGLKEEDYAQLIFSIVEDGLPTAMVAHRIDRLSNSQPLKTFFTRNPNFDVRTPVRTYLEANPNALDFVTSETERRDVEKRLKGLERAYRIAPPGARVETMEVLLKDGVDSAQKIRALGKSAFNRRYKESLGLERAEKVWTRANNAAALAAMVISRHSALFDRTPIHVLPKRVETVSKLPSYEEMFGSVDFCSCEHCRSVFGPAAYLVDLLHWLDNRPAMQTGKTALDLLFDARRSDIGAIELSCTNTNTPLPYIDLVNEALELTVAPVSPPPAYQTTGSTADLLAHPEHLHKGAYELLAGAQANSPSGKDAVYPFNLPFNLWIEEARTYVGQLGVPRYWLMEALQGDDVARADALVAAETLAMSPLEWDIIAGKPLVPSRTVAAFWGLPGDAAFVNKLKQVSFLLERATPAIAENAMEFEELADLLRTDFVQQPAALGVWFNGQTCDTTKAEVIGLTEASLDRIHRFIRLRRRLGWSALDLDRTIQVLGGGTLDEACLLKISHVRRLATDLHLPVAELLGWWGRLDTRRWTLRLRPGIPAGAPPGVDGFGIVFDNKLTTRPQDGEDASPYDRVFQTTSTSAEPNDVFGVNPNGDALANETRDLSGNLPAIAGALGVTAEDLGELLPRLPDGKLSLSNLSALYRHVSLARELVLKIRDLASLLALTGIDPFDAAHTENALSFVDEVQAIRDSGSSISELDYLLRHRDTKPATPEPDDQDIGVLFFELGGALRKVEIDHLLPVASATIDELRRQFVSELEIVLAAVDVTKTLAIVDIEAGATPPPGAETFIGDKLKGIFDLADARKKLLDRADPAYLNDPRARLEYGLSARVTHVRKVGKTSAVIDKIASAVGLDVAIAAPLLRRHLKHPDATGRPLLAVFSEVTVAGSDEPVLPGPADLTDQFAAYKRMHKAALVLNCLRITEKELDWVLERGPAQGTLDFHGLPLAPNSASVPYASWARLRDAAMLRDLFSPRQVFDLFAAASAIEAAATPAAIADAHEAFLAELERRSLWNKADIEFLIGTPTRGTNPAVPGVLGFTYPAGWKDERPLKRLAEVMAIVRRVGLPAATLWLWRNIPLPAGASPEAQKTAIDQQALQANEIKQAVRARHEEAQWYQVARTLRDSLREHQRDVLVGWLVGNDPRFADANALFEHLLLDVEMSPCQLTSRIKQAISSVQLFVQRALMGLETDDSGAPLVELPKDDADEWEWMKSYRVWEANRKVFLYPENWIEPELRDNKTPFFRELEDELLQSEVTAESAERAVRGYLERLDQVARLEIVGVCQQVDGGAEIVHVFGRTRGTPAIYFYRQRINKSFWTPWEKVEADIEGDHLIPVVFNRRLYIFWPLITESALEEQPDIPATGSLPTPTDAPKKYYQLTLRGVRQGHQLTQG